MSDCAHGNYFTLTEKLIIHKKLRAAGFEHWLLIEQ